MSVWARSLDTRRGVCGRATVEQGERRQSPGDTRRWGRPGAISSQLGRQWRAWGRAGLGEQTVVRSRPNREMRISFSWRKIFEPKN